MNTPLIDLHVHSSCSDGTFSPAELVSYAREKGLAAFALTDHDTTAGLRDAFAAAEGTGMDRGYSQPFCILLPGQQSLNEFLFELKVYLS